MKKTSEYLIAIAGWFAVGVQFGLWMRTSTLGTGEAVLRFFSYFTILTNILVATRFTILAVKDDHTPAFFARPGVQTALTVYIIVVSCVYNLVLRFLWAPQGMQKVVDELLHTVIPIASLWYWWRYVPASGLRYKDCIGWLWFPLAYIAWVVAVGAGTGFYPYPFVDVTRLGYGRALLNGLGLMMIFIGLSLFLVAIAQWRKRSGGPAR